MAFTTLTAIALWWRAEGRVCKAVDRAHAWRDAAAVWELSASTWQTNYRELRARLAEKQLTVFSPMHMAPRGLDD